MPRYRVTTIVVVVVFDCWAANQDRSAENTSYDPTSNLLRIERPDEPYVEGSLVELLVNATPLAAWARL